MRLSFRQRFLSWFDSYDIYDEAGETVYTVEGKLSWGHRLEIHDRAGRYLGRVQEELFTLLPRFVIYLGEDRAGGCLTLLEQIGFQGELLEERGDALTFGQTWGGRRLFNLQVTVTAESGGASGMTAGRRLVGEPEEDSARQAIDPASALVELFNGISALGDVCNQISALEQGYVSGASLSGPMTLTPVWQVTTDTGFYQLDLVTGGVSRLS